MKRRQSRLSNELQRWRLVRIECPTIQKLKKKNQHERALGVCFLVKHYLCMILLWYMVTCTRYHFLMENVIYWIDEQPRQTMEAT